jgi:hypothetical protein
LPLLTQLDFLQPMGRDEKKSTIMSQFLVAFSKFHPLYNSLIISALRPMAVAQTGIFAEGA